MAGKRITEFYAFVHVEQDGNENTLVAWNRDRQQWVPMCANSPDVVERLKPLAHQIAAEQGRPVRLLRFTAPTVVQVFKPQPAAEEAIAHG